MTNYPLHKPEVMSPAGYWPQLRAAIEAGADAVYFGLTHFSARAKVGFTLEELPEVMRTLHGRGVKGYLTFNTLVFDDELEQAARWLAQVAEAGVDSLIVQDIGIAQLAHTIAPDLPIHGSTQMSISSAEGIALAQRFGVTRVVLARELSLADIRSIRAQTECELEMFVHGALCVSYSGQCFSSEAWGGRSANRGQCAQACRLPYDLIVDDQRMELGDKRYLLSPGDLYALQQIPEIVPIGVSALKIEGRYKDAEYVALTTAAYRKAVDEAWKGLPLSVDGAEELRLEQVYSRGLGPWFVQGVNHQQVVDGRAPRHRGVLAGRVLRVLDQGVLVAQDQRLVDAPLKPGDGLVFDAAGWRSPEEKEEGGRIYEIFPRRHNQLELRFGNGAIRYERIRAGDLVWRTQDSETERAARPWVEATSPVHRQPVQVEVRAVVGESLSSRWRVLHRPEVAVEVIAPEPLAAAANRGIEEATLREQLGRLGNTPYQLASLSAQVEGLPFVPVSLLNAIRREAVERLQAVQSAPAERMIANPLVALEETAGQYSSVSVRQYVSDQFSDAPPAEHRLSATDNRPLATDALTHRPTDAPTSTRLHLLVRTPEQLDAAIAVGPDSITLDYLELYGLRPAVERVQMAGIAVRVASPRVLKPDEQKIVNFLLRLGAPVLVRSGGLLETLRAAADHPALTGDFSLNAANAISARTLLALGLERLAPTYDLNAAQIAALAQELSAGSLEAIAYSHLPVFHTEHCVFCRFLSSGTSYKDCGHPCESHKIGLRDTQGRIHPVLADVGCRNTVFGAQAQEASDHLALWRSAGILDFRLEFAHESANEVREIAAAFRDTLDGALSSAALTRQLRRYSPQGVTQGSLFVPAGTSAIPLFV